MSFRDISLLTLSKRIELIILLSPESLKSDSLEERRRKLRSQLVVCLVIAMSLWSSDSMETVLKNLVNGLSRMALT